MLPNDKISDWLMLKDVMKSEIAQRKGLNNMPDADSIQNLMHWGKFIYDPLCEHFGIKLSLTSVYRSPLVNKAIGGSKTSQHCFGQAGDIDTDNWNGIRNSDVFNAIRHLRLPFDQLIWEFGTDTEPAWVHVSYSNRHRKQMLRAIKISNGKSMSTRYLNYPM